MLWMRVIKASNNYTDGEILIANVWGKNISGGKTHRVGRTIICQICVWKWVDELISSACVRQFIINIYNITHLLNFREKELIN